jgi:cephalosporin hydroxylase
MSTKGYSSVTDIEASIQELREIWGQGAGIHKRPSDLSRYEILIKRVKPEVIVETGLYYGGSALWFAERVPYIINVEINHQTTEDYRNNVHGLGFPPENGIIVEGNSHEVYGEVAALARELADDKPILVVLDSNHDTETVYGEAIRYGQLVQSGSYMVIEDGLLHYLPQEGANGFQGPNTQNNWFNGCPLCATERFLAEQGDHWIVDAEIEDMFPTTQHVGGWLRRK